MKKRYIVLIVVASILAAMLGTGIYIYDMYNRAKDYESILAVSRDKLSTAQRAAAIEPTPTAELQAPDVLFTPSPAPSSVLPLEASLETASTPLPTPSGREEKTELPRQQGIVDADKVKADELRTSNTNIINVLFLGIDRTDDRDKTLGVYRTDTIALASIDLKTKKVEVLSIPRDTYVYIPKKDMMDKINHAYVWGGMGKKGIESTVDTVNRFIKYSEVDYYFAIDMEPVPEIVDKLGGVEMDVEIDMKDHGASLSKGFQLLDGNKAYQYIRWRYDGTGDIGRIKRQQKFMKAMYNKLKDEDQLITAVELVLKYNQNVKTNMSIIKILAFANLMIEIKQENVNYNIVPGYYKNIDGESYWGVKDNELNNLLSKMFFVKE